MAMTVNMPQLGESVTEGTIARWLKQPGELVAKYESIAEVVTDKVNAEIPAPAEGSMGEHIAKEGDVVAVGQPICSIETVEQGQANSAWHQGDEGAPAQAQQAPAQPAAQQQGQPEGVEQEERQPQPQQAVTAGAQQSAAPVGEAQIAPPQQANGSGSAGGATTQYHLTPAVRMLVREHEVDLAQVQGTGLEGRISKKDVLDYVQRRDAGGAPPPAAAAQQPQAQPAPQAAAASPQPAPAAPQPAPAPAPAPQPQRADGDQVIPLTPTRRAIAEHMVRSRHTAPHAWLTMEVDMSSVARLRAARRAEFEQRYGAKLTYLPFVARAVCDALREYPTLNASWSDEGIIVRRDLNLGIAVALEESLIVPVIRNADRFSLAGLAVTMQDLGDRARTNKLKLDEIQGGTFTLNNTGALGTVLTQAIINQPQAGILAMDAVVKRAVVVNDAIAIRPMMNLGLSFDHRINDGLVATRFVKKVKDLLENIDDSGAML
ncbi:MAG TPA: dihydrolipoamide acetyltransferase family protein [Candidatus Deferrimicrobium sp.]|nr:dihydrolipoamide acetyltransferase family protein [Candidatus Deferrimicrobium sp.]